MERRQFNHHWGASQWSATGSSWNAQVYAEQHQLEPWEAFTREELWNRYKKAEKELNITIATARILKIGMDKAYDDGYKAGTAKLKDSEKEKDKVYEEGYKAGFDISDKSRKAAVNKSYESGYSHGFEAGDYSARHGGGKASRVATNVEEKKGKVDAKASGSVGATSEHEEKGVDGKAGDANGYYGTRKQGKATHAKASDEKKGVDDDGKASDNTIEYGMRQHGKATHAKASGSAKSQHQKKGVDDKASDNKSKHEKKGNESGCARGYVIGARIYHARPDDGKASVATHVEEKKVKMEDAEDSGSVGATSKHEKESGCTHGYEAGSGKASHAEVATHAEEKKVKMEDAEASGSDDDTSEPGPDDTSEHKKKGVKRKFRPHPPYHPPPMHLRAPDPVLKSVDPDAL